MIASLTLLTLLAGRPSIEAAPADPLLGKVLFATTLPYLRRLKPEENVYFAFIGDIPFLEKELSACGKIQTKTASTITAILPVKDSLRLAADPRVYELSMGYVENKNLPRMGSAYSDNPTPLTPSKVPLADRPYGVTTWPVADLRKLGWTGKGVVVGVVEGHPVDFRHPDFTSDDGKTRFHGLWDQWDTKAQKAPGGFNYGYSYEAAELNAMLTKGEIGSLKMGSASDHVTCSAGVAAGNGRTLGKYCGVAPESTIVACSVIPAEPNQIDAIRYIFDQADKLGLPAVVNMSLAIMNLQGLSGDGSDVVSLAFSDMVKEKLGRIIVSSAGNQAALERHAEVKVDSGSEPNYVLVPFLGQNRYLHTIVVPKTDQIEMKLELVLVKDKTVTPLETTDWFKFQDLEFGKAWSLPMLHEGAGIDMNLIPKWHNRGMREIALDLVAKKTAPGGSYGIRVTYRGAGTMDVYSHGYLEHKPKFDDDASYVSADSLQSTSTAASGECVIASGAYVDTAEWTMADGSKLVERVKGAVAEYSQPGGPLWGSYKPLVLSPSHIPGTLPIDSRTNDDKKKVLAGSYEPYGGTSASGPVLAGGIALYLQKHPKATFAQVEQALRESAFGDEATGPVPNPKCGFGKLDLRRFLEK